MEVNSKNLQRNVRTSLFPYITIVSRRNSRIYERPIPIIGSLPKPNPWFFKTLESPDYGDLFYSEPQMKILHAYTHFSWWFQSFFRRKFSIPTFDAKSNLSGKIVLHRLCISYLKYKETSFEFWIYVAKTYLRIHGEWRRKNQIRETFILPRFANLYI